MSSNPIYLENGFPEHPKVIAAGPLAAWLFVAGLGWLKRTKSTDGRIPKGQAALLADVPKSAIAKLVDVRLWHDDGDAYLVHEYVIRNAKAIQTSLARSAAAHAKWAAVAAANASAEACKTDANADASASEKRANKRTREPENQGEQESVGSKNPRREVGDESSGWRPVTNEEPPDDSPPLRGTSPARFEATRLADVAFGAAGKPTVARGKVVDLLAAEVQAGTPVTDLEAVCRAGGATWTVNGLRTAVGIHQRQRAPRPERDDGIMSLARSIAGPEVFG
jgi:hypothetical protein